MAAKFPTRLLLAFLVFFLANASNRGPRRNNLKMTHLHFYFHDLVRGRFPTAVQVVRGVGNGSPTGFGSVTVIDDRLTSGPEPNSTLVGRAQGIYTCASQEELSLLMVLNFAFTSGKYNGSSLSVLGRNAVLSGVSEIAVVGGSGKFRFVRGYATAKTHMFDQKTGNAVVEYHVYLMHF